MYSNPPSAPWSVLLVLVLLLCAAIVAASASDEDRFEGAVCSLGWGYHALTLFVQFWLLDLVALDRNSRPSRGLACICRWTAAFARACLESVKSICKCKGVCFKDLLDEARVEEEKHLDVLRVIDKGMPYLEERKIGWMAMSLPSEPRSSSVRLYFIAGMYLDGKRLEANDAQSHARLLNQQKQHAQAYLRITLRGAKRTGSLVLHMVMVINVLLATSNTVGALLWLVKLPSIVGAAYATSRLGMKAVGLGIFQWAATRLPDGFYLMEGADLEDVQTRCQYLKTNRIWNLSDLCGECTEVGESSWWLLEIGGYDGNKCGIVRGGVLWSKVPKPVEIVLNYPYCIPAGCAVVGYAMFVWPYCWIAAAVITILVIGDKILEHSTALKLPFKVLVVTSILALIMAYDMFILAAGMMYTGTPYWDAVRRSYHVGDTECALRDKLTTVTECLTLI